MVKRRSYGDALTAGEQAFLKNAEAKPAAKASKLKSPRKSKSKQEEPDMSKSALKQTIPAEALAIPAAPTFAPVTPSYLSVRIDPRIAAAYLRAMTERRIEGRAPWTQQDIVAEAMTDWLKKHGYFR